MKRIYMHPLPVRVWHWINAFSFLLLIVTGLQLRYRDIFKVTSFKTAVDLHNFFGFVLIFNFFLWLLYYLFTGKIRIYIPQFSIRGFITGCLRQAKYYGYGIFMGDENPHHSTPENKFNPMQQVAYLNIMALFIPLQIITGLFMWDMKGFAYWIGIAGGIKVVDSVHVLLFLFFTSFLFVHIYLATLGHSTWAHIKAMFVGYEEEPEHAHTH
ncbi:MAG: cytochrome b/b6 domain-containing protein [Thermodesulfovibrionales bacterium]